MRMPGAHSDHLERFYKPPNSGHGPVLTTADVKGKTQAWILFEASQGTPGAARFLFYGPQGQGRAWGDRWRNRGVSNSCSRPLTACYEHSWGVIPQEDAQQPQGGWIRNGLKAGRVSTLILMGSIKLRDISSKSDCFSFIRKSPEGLQTCANCTCHKIDGFSQQLLPDVICCLNPSSTKDLEAVHAISRAWALSGHCRPCLLFPWTCGRP